MKIVCTRPVTLIGGAKLNRVDLTATLTLAPDVVAADGGANAALAEGLNPLAVFGDMDSISAQSRAAFASILKDIREQDTTDFDKALRHINAPLVIAHGFSGGRLDHELAALNALVRHYRKRCILVGPESLTFLCPPSLMIGLAPDTIVSLFPMAPCGVRSTGLRWPTDGIGFAPDGPIGTSNTSTGDLVRIDADRPSMLVILPKTALGAAAAALAPERPNWPGAD